MCVICHGCGLDEAQSYSWRFALPIVRFGLSLSSSDPDNELARISCAGFGLEIAGLGSPEELTPILDSSKALGCEPAGTVRRR